MPDPELHRYLAHRFNAVLQEMSVVRAEVLAAIQVFCAAQRAAGMETTALRAQVRKISKQLDVVTFGLGAGIKAVTPNSESDAPGGVAATADAPPNL